MNRIDKKQALRKKRKLRIRKKVAGSVERPRLTVYRSATNIYAQVIDDVTGKTLASIHSFKSDKRAGKEQCSSLGKELAAKCKEQKITQLVFDKNGYAFHGRVKAFADGVREGGIKF
ncbi:MAG: 50S ribosomal protein L18 [Oligoflexales bacterium]